MGQADAGVTHLSAFPCTAGANPHLLQFLSGKESNASNPKTNN